MKKEKKKIIILIGGVLLLIGAVFLVFEIISNQKLKEELSKMKMYIDDEEVKINYSETIDLNELVKNVEGGELTIHGEVNSDKVGEYKIVYKITNSDGLVKEEVVTISVVDEEKPIIKLDGSKVNVILNDKVDTKSGVSAEDNYDGDLTDKIEITGTVNTEKEGTYEVKYNVKDSSGNSAEQVIRTYIVEDIPELVLNKSYADKKTDKSSSYSLIFSKNNKITYDNCAINGGCITTVGTYKVNGNKITATYTYTYHLSPAIDKETFKKKQVKTYTITKSGIKEDGTSRVYVLQK